MEQAIEISGDMIRLGQLLKLAGAASGGDAKTLIAGGQVTVNGEPELRRGRQLHPGDLVCVGAAVLRIAGRVRSAIPERKDPYFDDRQHTP